MLNSNFGIQIEISGYNGRPPPEPMITQFTDAYMNPQASMG